MSSYSHTNTYTWTWQNARAVAGQVAADLRGMQQEYGKPSDIWIEWFLKELTELLHQGYLKQVTYGYSRDGNWTEAVLQYTAADLGTLSVADRSGRVTRGVNITGATWYSFLEYSAKWLRASHAERQSFEATLPFTRSDGLRPGTGGGAWQTDKTYSSGDGGVRRAKLVRSW